MAKLYTRKSDGTYVPNNPQSVTNIDVVQATGDSVTATMSQDAVTKELATKQDTLTTGNGISIEGNVIGVTAITESESQPDTSLWLNPSEDEETDVTYNRSQIDAMVGAKQDALQLTVKDNGNIVLSNIQGQSKEFMPATPSGDPMHYAYEAAGAEYNDTGADIVKTTPWADLADDDADKTVVHKAGYWYLNGLGDITTEQIRNIYNTTINFGISPSMGEALKAASVRTNFFLYHRQGTSATDMYQTFYKTYIEVGKICFRYNTTSVFYNIRFLATSNHKTRHFVGIFDLQMISSGNNVQYAFDDCTLLKTINIKNLKVSLGFPNTSMLTTKSILYMINNEKATSDTTITLHADVYATAMANAHIVAALEAHPNISLASAYNKTI